MEMSRRDAVVTIAALPVLQAAPKVYTMYAGTYTRDGSKGIYAYKFEPEAGGKVTELGLAAETANPSFLTIHPNGKFLYAVGELSEFQGQRAGAVQAFAIEAPGKLKLLNSQPTGGQGPCHLNLDGTQKLLMVVNYGSGSASVFPVKADGALAERTGFVQHTGSGPNAQRQQGPHAHSVNVSKSNKWAVVADLGIDEFIVYKLDAAAGTIERHSAAKVKGGSGPRHFSFHPSNKFAYGVNEMASAVSAFKWDEGRGELTEIQTISTLPKDFTGQSSCAEILTHPSGKFVYASNRGHDSLAIFAIDQAKGTLTAAGHALTLGKTPRNFRIDPTGGYVVCGNQNTNNIVVFKVDASTGALTPTGQELSLPAPVCFRFI